ncbi:O-antigen ligase family protein [Marinomonas sp. PE14-40]|uniref:O-antigen ligase family protein n=1 Tax=Marinomonas sp. PE14-40 TaxID=3060621 RepID=UPI003F673E8B
MLNVKNIYESCYFNGFMFCLILVYTSSYIIFETLSKTTLLIFLLFSFPLVVKDNDLFKKDPMFILLLFSIVVQFFSWVNSQIYFPEFSSDYPKLDRLLKLFSFIFVAYWLGGSVKRVLMTMLSFVLGFIVSVFLSVGFYESLIDGFNGFRVDFGIKNAQFTSMFSGVSLIITAFFILNNKVFFEKRFLTLFIFTLCFTFSSLFLLFSQSRQTWLAISITLFLAPIFASFLFEKFSNKKLLTSFFIILLCIYSFSYTDFFEKRFVQQTIKMEEDVINNFLSGDFDEIPSSSGGIRLKSWIDAVDWIGNHPILGSGENSINQVMLQSKRFTSNVKKKYTHLHSYHIELLVAYGLLGALVIYGMYYWLIRSLVLAHRENPDLKTYTVLGMCFLIFWIIINSFESFSSRSYGVYVHNIMFGCLYTFYFAQQRKKLEETEVCA